MNGWNKLLSVALAAALCLPALTVAPSAAGQEEVSGAYAVYAREDDRLSALIFETGTVGSAEAAGYGQFYTSINASNNQHVFDGSPAQQANLKPTGYIKFVLKDGILVITNDLSDEEIEEIAARVPVTNTENGSGAREYEMSWLEAANFLQNGAFYDRHSVFYDNPNIETVIVGPNVRLPSLVNTGPLFQGCVNLKNVISVDYSTRGLVYGSHIDYAVNNISGEEHILFSPEENMEDSRLTAMGVRNPADLTAYVQDNWGNSPATYFPADKGAVFVRAADGDLDAQLAQARACIADMELPDWALAFLPESVGGTQLAASVTDVFNFPDTTFREGWQDGAPAQPVEPPPAETEPDPPVTEQEPVVSGWAEEMVAAYLSEAQVPDEVREIMGGDYTRSITRYQFAVMAVQLYEHYTQESIPLSPRDDVFADSAGDLSIAKAYNIGILSGYNTAKDRADIFVGPGDKLTREQAAAMLVQLAEAAGRPVGAQTGELPFTDEISDWAADAVARVYGAGIMSGTSGTTFDAQGPYTIEQAMVTMLRSYEAMRSGG